MIVCIAEKPSVAEDIAKIIGATQRHRVGRNAGYFEGNGYQVTWTFGHLCELKDPEQYTPYWKTWSLSALPMIPERFGIRLKEGVEEQFGVIRELFGKAERIINCGDAGQEGELIQRWVMQKASAQCPVERLWISSMTEEAIREGFAQLRPQEEYRGLYEAGLCRAIGDWLLGMNATRLYTLKFGDRSRRGAQPLSIGRVQTPTLALIVHRQQEIERFVPEPYWVLSTVYRDTTFTARLDTGEEEEEGKTAERERTENKGAAKRGFTDRAEAEAALRAIENTPFTVTAVTKKKGSEAPPRLFDLTALQVECNRKFGYGADLTLEIVQQLYEAKYTTYPRVDTTFLPDDMYGKSKGILNGLSGLYGDLLTPLRGEKLRKSKKVFDSSKVTDHHAIIPTGVPPRALTDVQRRVYDLIARRFIAVFYPDCRFATTTVDGEAADVPFRATGKVILDEGWRAVFRRDATKDENTPQRADEERTLPDFTKGESGPHTPTLTAKETTPPKPFTEATLLRAMETAGRTVDNEELRDALKENGIGRPSTRAAIIQTLFRRGYIRRRNKSLEATPTGVELIGVIKEELLKSAELTGQWENKLRRIEHHAYSAQQFIAELKQMVCELVDTVLRDANPRRVTASASAELPARLTAKKGESTTATATAPPNEKPKRKVIRAGSPCPQCGEGKVLKGKTAYGCSRWKEGCTWRKPFKK
jgi:DNA topoisomerase III